MPSAATESLPNFSTTEWAVIWLMKRTQEVILKPLLHQWAAAIQEGSNAILLQNVFAGLRFASRVWGPEYTPTPNTSESVLREPIPKDVLPELLSNGHLLFNTYYYDLVDVFGEKSLLPVVLGRARQNDFDAVMRFLSQRQLPFRLNRDYLETYVSQVLPCTGGVTPLHVKRFMEGGADRVVRLQSFLGDLGLLHQREDFSSGHVSALVAALGKSGADCQSSPRSCIGAFVLTSVIPEAFTEEDSTRLDQLVADALNLGMLSPGDRLGDPESSSVLIRDLRTAPLVDDAALEQEFESWLARELESGASEGLVSARVAVAFGTEGDRLLDACAVNSGAVSRLFRRAFPTGPWLAPSISAAEADRNETSVAPERLARYGEHLRSALVGESAALRADSLKILEEEFRFFSTTLRHVIPELGSMWGTADFLDLASHVLPLPCGGSLSTWLIVICRPQADMATFQVPPALEGLRELVLESSEFGCSLEGENTILAGLEAAWEHLRPPGKSTGSGAAPSRSGASAERLFSALSQVMLGPEIAAVLVCQKRPLYIPSVSMGAVPEAPRTYLSHGAFWVFERLSRIFGSPYLSDYHRVDPVLVNYDSLLFKDYLPHVSVHLTRVGSSRESQQLENTLLFLGVPVRFFTEGEEFDVTVDSVSFGTDILGAYRCFLNAAMARASALPWLARLLGSRVESVFIRSLNETTASEGWQAVEQVLAVAGRTFRVQWSPSSSLELVLLCLNPTPLQASWERWWRLEGEDRLRDVNGGKGHWLAGSVQSSVVQAGASLVWSFHDTPSLRSIAIRASEVYARQVRREEQRRRVQAEQEAVWKDFSRAAAHRLDNPLLTAHLSVDSARRRLEQKRYGDAFEHLERIDRAVEAARNRVWRFRQLASRETEHLERVRISECLKEAEDTLVVNRVPFQVTIEPDADEVFAERRQLREAFSELAINALRFLEGRTSPYVEFSARIASREAIAQVGLSSDADFVEVQFSDNGPGVAVDRKEEIFIAYISSSTDHDGMGLAIVRTDIRRLGGEIKEIGTFGKGAVFQLFLPLARASGAQ